MEHLECSLATKNEKKEGSEGWEEHRVPTSGFWKDDQGG